MKCYKCGSFLYEGDYCNACGADVAVYRQIVLKSNEFYNSALEYAKDRNLTRAVECLKTSLKMFRGNVSAHNLLGLVYFEMGEYTRGCAHWVISKNLQPENNLANTFLNQMQEDQIYLDTLNQTIKKYNKAVRHVEQKNYDLAEIQLKKLLNENANLLQAYLLLALLRIRKKKYAAAKTVLLKAQKIDGGNPTAIAYMNFVNSQMRSEEKELTTGEIKAKHSAEISEEGTSHTPLSGDDVIIPKSSYREYNAATMTIIQVLIGFVVGAAFIFFVIVPAKTNGLKTQYANVEAELQAQVSDLTKEVDSLKNGGTSTEEQNESSTTAKLKAQVEEAEQLLADERTLLEAYKIYKEYNGQSNQTGADALMAIKYPEKLDETSKEVYEDISSMFSYYTNQWYTKGVGFFQNDDYDNALEQFEAVWEKDKTNGNALYYMGLCYFNKDDESKAKELLLQYQSEFPDGEHASDCAYLLSERLN